MKAFVTGGAGFIGSWVTHQLLKDGHEVVVLDDLSNGHASNLDDCREHKNFIDFIEGDIKDRTHVEELFNVHQFDICYHLGASINVQDSIDDPETTFLNDTVGTFTVLEACKKHQTKLVFMSTCMVYDRCIDVTGITENHPTKPASPYAGAKIAAENMVLSYFYAYDLPTVVIRPFNTYGPLQKTGGEGGVVSIFIQRKLSGEMLNIYGDGVQTRDLLYVEDCARFVVQCGYRAETAGHIINAGLGRDISINDLALHIVGDQNRIQHVTHIHPQSEIMKLKCNYDKAKNMIGWAPLINLEEGIKRTEEWIKTGQLQR